MSSFTNGNSFIDDAIKVFCLLHSIELSFKSLCSRQFVVSFFLGGSRDFVVVVSVLLCSSSLSFFVCF